jgi:hypothetical protein
MATNRNIHFKGIDNIVKAYEHMDIPAFAVFSCKQLMYSNDAGDMAEGEAALKEYLTLMSNQNWEHLTLRVYRDVPEKGIKALTDYDGSFNFQLMETPEGYQALGGMGNAIVSRLTAIEKKMAEGDEDDGAVDDDYGLGKIGRALSHPALLPLVEPLTNRLMDWLEGTKSNVPTASMLSGIPSEKKMDPAAVQLAVDRLSAHVDDLPALLNKLADMAVKTPVQFKFYMNMFARMRI